MRFKGFFTLADRTCVTGWWSQSGAVTRVELSSARDTDSPNGQELVFIGTHLHADARRAALNDCLHGDYEALPPMAHYSLGQARRRRRLQARVSLTGGGRLPPESPRSSRGDRAESTTQPFPYPSSEPPRRPGSGGGHGQSRGRGHGSRRPAECRRLERRRQPAPIHR
ncbi:GTP-binding protein [Streptomyces sp. NBC_00322]